MFEDTEKLFVIIFFAVAISILNSLFFFGLGQNYNRYKTRLVSMCKEEASEEKELRGKALLDTLKQCENQ